MAVCRSETNFVGEVYELRSELNADLHLVRKEAVKKVIASMTLGKDVSSLFPDVLKNVSTEDMEMKKLVYLYLMNYATSQPELVVLAINTFCKVCPFPWPPIHGSVGCGGRESTGPGVGDPHYGVHSGGKGVGLSVYTAGKGTKRQGRVCAHDGSVMCSQGVQLVTRVGG